MPETSRLVATEAAVPIERFNSRLFRLEGIMVGLAPLQDFLGRYVQRGKQSFGENACRLNNRTSAVS